MSNKISDMAPAVQGSALQLDQAWTDAGIAHVISETLRVQIQQIARWVQSRAAILVVNLLRKVAGYYPFASETENTWATNCDGVNTPSRHQSGRAMDAQPLVPHTDAAGKTTMVPTWNYAAHADLYKKMGAIARAMGWTWGGDWLPLDPATGLGTDPDHYEFP
jgi:hypothetical protein